MRAVPLLATVLILMFLPGNTAQACDCVTLSQKESFENADFVFEGRLVGIQRVQSITAGGDTYVFEIDKTLKGPYLTTIALSGGGGDCDANFQPKFAYRVYANNYSGTFVSGSCSGNQVLGQVRGFTTYATTYSPPLSHHGFTGLLAACGLGFLLGSGVFVWRKYVSRVL